jgi:hypothetical protein
MEFEVLPSVTTTNNKWREKIKEITKLDIKKIGVFPTTINLKERETLYSLLEISGVTEIPFVHIRHDFTSGEIKYLIKRFKTRLFNIHTQQELPSSPHALLNDLSEFKKFIYIELSNDKLGNEINKYAGICLDTAHVENQRLNKTELYNDFIGYLEKYPIGVVHISAIKEYPRTGIRSKGRYDCHRFRQLSEFDYVPKYKKYLPKMSVLELENPISEQLKVVSYLEKLLTQN